MKQQDAFKAALDKIGKTWDKENEVPDLEGSENEEKKMSSAR